MPCCAAFSPMLRGLYAITPDISDAPTLLAQVQAAADGGLRLLQYRNKTASPAQRATQVQQLADFCRPRNIVLIINDDVALAKQHNVGVHIGGDDMPVAAARRLLGKHAIIGSSCQNSIATARRRIHAGADYIAMGAVFTTTSKQDTQHCALSTLRTAKQELAVPLAAIGGINTTNAAAVIDAGADMVAVINGVFGSSDITATTRAFCRLFSGE